MDELERELAEKIKEIKPVDQKAIEIAKKRWDSIAHPLHSLGLCLLYTSPSPRDS